MARVNLKKDDVISKVIINVNINGKLYKDICLEYEEDADWKLTWDLHLLNKKYSFISKNIQK